MNVCLSAVSVSVCLSSSNYCLLDFLSARAYLQWFFVVENSCEDVNESSSGLEQQADNCEARRYLQ